MPRVLAQEQMKKQEAKSNLEELLVFPKECNTYWRICFVSFPQQTFIEEVTVVFERSVGDLQTFFISLVFLEQLPVLCTLLSRTHQDSLLFHIHEA